MERVRTATRGLAILLAAAWVGIACGGGDTITAIVPVARIDVTPARITLDIGMSVQLTATVKDAEGTLLPYPITWRAEGAATVSEGGLVTAVGPGEATITATSEGVSGMAVVRVERVTAVIVSPATMVLYPADTMRLAAAIADGTGMVLSRTVHWASDRPGVATVDGAGFVTAIAAGSTTITASSEGVTGAASVVVLARVAHLMITPPTASMLPSQQVQLSATVQDAMGGVLVRPVTWSSSASGIASVDANGLVTAIAPGRVDITAASEGSGTSASITVLAPVHVVSLEPVATTLYLGATQRLSATIFDATGDLLSRTVAWSSSSPGVATVDAAGLVRALAPGTTTITATAAGIVGAANVTVVAPVGDVQLSPSSVSLLTAESIQLTPVLRDLTGAVVVRPIAWSSESPAIASVSSNGRVTAIASGTAVVRAVAEGVAATAEVTVLARVASLVITPDSAAVVLDGSVQLAAVATDAQGRLLERTVAWSSSRPDRATVDSRGRVIGISVGTAEISAVCEGQLATAIISILAPVARVSIAAAPDSIDVSATVQLVATPLDADGDALDRTVLWTSSNPGVAEVDPSGLVRGRTPGVSTITARSESKAASRSIRVMVPVARTEIATGPTQVVANQSIVLAAVPHSASDEHLNRMVFWNSSNPAVATVNASGVVVGRSVGTTIITASSGGSWSTVTITVLPSIASIRVTASATTLTPESALTTVTAEPLDASGQVLPRPVTWKSSDTTVVKVTSTGPTTADVTLAGAGTASVIAMAEGQQGTVDITGHGPPVFSTTGNNLSWPVVFADGFSLLGDPVVSDVGLRPLASEGITVDSLPFWYHLNQPDQQSYYLQGGTNTWRAEWLDGSASGPHRASVAWGDNLTHHTYNTHTMIHVEVSLFALGVPDLRGFNMYALGGTASEEIQGADGSVGLFQPTLFSVHPRLLIQKLDTAGGTPQFTVVDQKVADGFGQEGPGAYRGELNRAGKVVYGYNFLVKDVTVPTGAAKYGWYRLSFVLEDLAVVGGQAVPLRLSLDELASSTDTEVPLYFPVLEPGGKRSYVDIYITSASGGGGHQ